VDNDHPGEDAYWVTQTAVEVPGSPGSGTPYVPPTYGYTQYTGGNMHGQVFDYTQDMGWLDEANLDFTWRTWPYARMVAGRQYQSYALGLLVDNERQAQEGLRLVWNDLAGTNVNLETFYGGSTPTWVAPIEDASGPDISQGDTYWTARASYQRPNWAIGANWLINGMAKEEGYSADLWTRFWGGRELKIEYAVQTQALDGDDYVSHSEPAAVLATVDVWKGNNWGLRGYFSDLDAEYDPWYSVANPYFEPYGINDNGSQWIQWGRILDNPLALSNLQVAGGLLDFSLFNADFQAAYYNVQKNSDFWGHTLWSCTDGSGPEDVPYDGIFTLGMTKKVADGVNFNLLYGHQMARSESVSAESSSGLDDVDIFMARVAVGF